MAFATWSVSDQQVSAKGVKLATITANGERVFITPTQTPLRMPFGGPGNFDKTPSVRQNLDFRATPELFEYFTALDTWMKDYLLCHSERIFKRQLSVEDINSGYHPIITQRGSYDPTFRTKVNLHEKGVTFWDADGKIRATPDSWLGLTAIPRLHVSHVWIMSREFGVVLSCTDLQIFESQPRECPFARMRSFVQPEVEMTE